MSIEKKVKVFDQSKNGVRVTVTKTYDAEGLLGSHVEADCTCFGNLNRMHSRYECPNFMCEEKIQQIMEE